VQELSYDDERNANPSPYGDRPSPYAGRGGYAHNAASPYSGPTSAESAPHYPPADPYSAVPGGYAPYDYNPPRNAHQVSEDALKL